MIRMKIFLLLLTAGFVTNAWAKVNILSCEPEWAALATEIGGDEVKAASATTGLQDPHHIQARPSLIARARRADLLVCTGAELEIGWLPLLLRKAGNPKIQAGQPGYFIATNYVNLSGVPTVADRAAGDVHSQGNPHIQTDPRNLLPVADALAERLSQIDPGHAAYFEQRRKAFHDRWVGLIAAWAQRAAPLRGHAIVVFHESWPYLEDWLGLTQVGTLEPKPGIPPTSGHLSALLEQLRQHPASLIIAAAYQDPKPARWLASRTDIPAVKMPFTVGGTDQAGNLEGLYDDTIRRLLDALQ